MLHQPLTRLRAKVNANDLARVYNTVITIDKAHFKLRLFKGLKFRKSYGVAVGQPAYPTPAGRFAIQDKQVDPVWSVPNSPWAGELQGTHRRRRQRRQPAQGALDGHRQRRRHPRHRRGLLDRHARRRTAASACTWPTSMDLFKRVPVGTPVLIQ